MYKFAPVESVLNLHVVPVRQFNHLVQEHFKAPGYDCVTLEGLRSGDYFYPHITGLEYTDPISRGMFKDFQDGDYMAVEVVMLLHAFVRAGLFPRGTYVVVVPEGQ